MKWIYLLTYVIGTSDPMVAVCTLKELRTQSSLVHEAGWLSSFNMVLEYSWRVDVLFSKTEA